MEDMDIRANPTIPIVIRAGKGKMSKIIKEAPIRHNKIPNDNLTMTNVLFSIK